MVVDTWLPRPKENMNEWYFHIVLRCLKYMLQIFVKIFVQHAAVSQWHWPFKNTSCITITMERTSWCIGKHENRKHHWAHQKDCPRACFRSRTASHRTIPARFGCAKRRRFGAAILPWRLGSEQKDSKTRRVSAPLRLAVENQSRWFLCSTILTKSKKDVFVARVWQSIFDLGAFLKQILEQCVRLSCVSSQETSMRFRRVGLQRDKNDKKNQKSIKKRRAPEHLCTFWKCVEFLGGFSLVESLTKKIKREMMRKMQIF